MRKLVFFLAALAVLVALLAGALLGDPLDRYDPIDEARAESIRARTASDQAWRVASQPVRLALYAGLGGVLVLGSGMLVLALYHHLERKNCTFYPDAQGVMPAVLLRPGEILADLGALAGPAQVTDRGVTYNLPPAVVPQLQAGANQGAATTRTMRAWASRQVAARQELAPWPALEVKGELEREFPPLEVLTGDESHIVRLLEEGEP
ncbi:MAG: hypothetical protein JXA37_12140 [Chloroflexia bacterium]|nr:hypothetical protein [Chloroflexia bacterium]